MEGTGTLESGKHGLKNEDLEQIPSSPKAWSAMEKWKLQPVRAAMSINEETGPGTEW